MAKNSTFVSAQRQTVSFSPKELTEAKSFLADKHPKSPYIAYFEQLKKAEEQLRNTQTYDFEKEMVAANEKESDNEEEEETAENKEKNEEDEDNEEEKEEAEEEEGKPKKRKAVAAAPKKGGKKAKATKTKNINEDVVEDFEFSDDE